MYILKNYVKRNSNIKKQYNTYIKCIFYICVKFLEKVQETELSKIDYIIEKLSKKLNSRHIAILINSMLYLWLCHIELVCIFAIVYMYIFYSQNTKFSRLRHEYFFLFLIFSFYIFDIQLHVYHCCMSLLNAAIFIHIFFISGSCTYISMSVTLRTWLKFVILTNKKAIRKARRKRIKIRNETGRRE